MAALVVLSGCSPEREESATSTQEPAPTEAPAIDPTPSNSNLIGVVEQLLAENVFVPQVTATETEDDLPIATVPITPEFDFEDVRAKAEELAAQPYKAAPALAKEAANLDYDAYRRIQVRPSASIWPEEPAEYRVVPDPRGYLFTTEVKLNVVEEGAVSPRAYNAADINFDGLPLSDVVKETLGFAGFRVLNPLNQPGKWDELISFRGASFFRALATGNAYGASARGLSVGTASAEGEKFPHFSEFWLVKPKAGDDTVKIYALLDGESATGAYEFRVSPGPETVIEVRATVFPRTTLNSVGIAPLTSMYFFSPHDLRKQADDFRPAVHDSEGLAIRMASGEWVWRPLINPRSLQISALADRAPLGFGLMQRKRAFDDYADIEADYEDRPSVWVEPGAGWGEGNLTLVEIPTVNEYNDNIVVFWKPREPWRKGQSYSFDYTMRWGLMNAQASGVAAVSQTFAGLKPGGGGPMFVVDFAPIPMALFEGAEVEISNSSGTVRNAVLKTNPETGKPRLTFELDPGGAELIELRALLTRGGKPITETWLYRWRKE